MKTAIRELFAIVAAWLRREGSLPGLLSAWVSLHLTHTTNPDRPIPYRVPSAR